MSGYKRLILKEPKKYSNSAHFDRIWRSFDGQKGYDVLFWQTDPARADTINITSSLNPLHSQDARPAALYGLSFLGRESVLDWLRHRTPATVRDLGTEKLGDHICQKVEFENLELGGKKGLNLGMVWFDKDADWLPRRIDVFPKRWIELSRQMTAGTVPTNPAPAVKIEPGEVMLQQEVAEFVKVADPLLGRPRWFPSRSGPVGDVRTAPAGARMSTIVLIESVKVNSPIDDSRFVPESSPGTMIRDNTAGVTPTLTFVGGDQGTAIRIQMSKRQSPDGDQGLQVPDAPNSASPTPVNSLRRPPDARLYAVAWGRWIAVAGLMLVVALVVRRRNAGC